MARPRTGQIRERDGRWTATVPGTPGGKPIERSFPTEVGARAWVDASWEALDVGHPAVDPSPYRVPNFRAPTDAATADDDDPLFEVLAREWHEETYEDFCRPLPLPACRRIAMHLHPLFQAVT